MATLFFRNRRLLAVTVLVILAAGLAALATVARQEDPTITNLFATVTTPFPGADPARVEALVTEKIEDELAEITEIDEITSTSRTGISVVSVELSEHISDRRLETVWSEIRDALADVTPRLPAGVPAPEFDNDRTGAYTAIAALSFDPGGEFVPGVLRRYAELLQDRLRVLPGTRLVDLYGTPEEALTVVIDPRGLASRGLAVDDVARAIAAADAKVPAGVLRGARSDYVVEVAGEIRSLERLRRIPVATGEDGRLVRVGDVAEITRGEREPPAELAFADGRRAVLVAARMVDGGRVDAWMQRLRSELSRFGAEVLPDGLEQQLLFDQSRYTAERLAGVARNLLLGMALVLGVLLLTLGWRAALIVAAILPLASLLSLAVLQRLGIPIQQMSVTGLVVALGLLVDTAIVMTDAIRQRLAAGVSRLEAVGEAVRRLAVPLLASTLTTALAFLPMALLPGPAGDFVGSIAIAVIIMLTAAFLLSVTVTPALAGMGLRAGTSGRGGQGARPAASAAIARGFSRSIALSLRHPRVALLGALVLPLTGFAAFPTLTNQFFPGVDRDQLYIQLHLRDGAAISETRRTALAAGRLLEAQAGIRAVQWVIGESAPSFYYNMIRDRDRDPAFAEALVTTASPAVTERLIPRLQRLLDERLPQAQIIVRGLVQGPPVSAPVELRLVGPDLAVLREYGDRLRALMLDDPGIVQARTELQGGAPKARLALDETRARLAGLTLTGAARQLDAALQGRTGGSLLESTEELPVRVRVGDAERDTVGDLRAMPLLAAGAPGAAARGGYPGIPVAALGDVHLVPAPTPIHRRDGERVNTVQGFVRRDVLPEEALARVRQRMADAGFTLPPGYRIEAGGDADARRETIANLLSPMGLIIAASVATLVLTFGSFRLAGVTGVVAVLSMGLSLLALAVLRLPFGIQAVIGVIGSIGVSINAAIIVLTALQHEPRALAGDPERIRAVVLAAARHITSTTVTTFAGFLPLILAGGGFWPPFAVAIAGGVLLSAVVSFYFTPSVFLLLARAGQRRGRPLPAAA